MLSSKFAAGLVVAASLALPAVALAASCTSVVGEHHGTFDADKRADTDDSGRPDSINGTWTATIDATCNVTGSLTSSLTGKVALKGTYGTYNPDTSKFTVNNLYLDASGTAGFDTFTLASDAGQHMAHYVLIQTKDYEYDGSFDGK
jgi:hypothetical protein